MTRSSGGASPAHTSSRGGTPASPAREVASSPCVTPVPLSPEEAYTRAVAPLLFDDDASIQKTSSFRGAAPVELGTEQQRTRSQAVATQLQALKDSLPCHWGSACAVRAWTKVRRLCGWDGGGTPMKISVADAYTTQTAPTTCEFASSDIHLPATFPSRPPSVRWLCTGGGSFRANPNLYQDGTVCLSLLGTWSGPGWEAGKSTLLQLVMSLQALVLNTEPYFNEPGYEGSRGTPSGRTASETYNVGIREGVAKHCVAAPLRALVAHPAHQQQQQPAPTCFNPFAGLLREHFLRKRTSLEALLANSGSGAEVASLLARLANEPVTPGGKAA